MPAVGGLSCTVAFPGGKASATQRSRTVGSYVIRSSLFNTLKQSTTSLAFTVFFSFFCLPSWCLCLHCSHGFVLCWFSFFLSISLFCGGFCFFCSVFYTALHHYAVQKHFSSRKQFDFLPKSLRACWSVSLWIFSKGRWQVTFWGFEERGLHAALERRLAAGRLRLISQKASFCGFHFSLVRCWCIQSGDACWLFLGGWQEILVGVVQGSASQRPWAASCLVQEANAWQKHQCRLPCCKAGSASFCCLSSEILRQLLVWKLSLLNWEKSHLT